MWKNQLVFSWRLKRLVWKVQSDESLCNNFPTSCLDDVLHAGQFATWIGCYSITILQALLRLIHWWLLYRKWIGSRLVANILNRFGIIAWFQSFSFTFISIIVYNLDYSLHRNIQWVLYFEHDLMSNCWRIQEFNIFRQNAIVRSTEHFVDVQ